MKGGKIFGLFCDIQGTLLVENKINKKVLSVLKKYERDGKKITIWTDGNPITYEKILYSMGVMYPVKSKFDYSGGVVEIAIDDMDQYTFSAITKITAEYFIKVSDLH